MPTYCTISSKFGTMFRDWLYTSDGTVFDVSTDHEADHYWEGTFSVDANGHTYTVWISADAHEPLRVSVYRSDVADVLSEWMTRDEDGDSRSALLCVALVSGYLARQYGMIL